MRLRLSSAEKAHPAAADRARPTGPGPVPPLALAAGEAMSGLGQQFESRAALPAPRVASALAPCEPPVAGCRAHSDGEEARILKHQPDAARFGQQIAQRPAPPVQLVTRRPVQPGDDAQQAALPQPEGPNRPRMPPAQGQFTVEGKAPNARLTLSCSGCALRVSLIRTASAAARCSTPYTSTSITSEKPIRPPASRWAF